MHFEKPDLASLSTESDVEQKLLFPLLSGTDSSGLGIDQANIHTKANIRKFVIGKGAEQKSYFPDYVIVEGGFPILICEAKKPGSDLAIAFREAILYANEINIHFQSGVQPVSLIIVTNGTEIRAGKSDVSIPTLTLNHSDISIHNQKFVSLQTDFGFAALKAKSNILSAQLRPSKHWKPRKLVGGIAIQKEEVGYNSFGSTISSSYANIFNPLSLDDRSFIAKNGYIASRRRERYVEPIDRVIRASVPLSEARSKTLEDSSKPKEIIKVFRATKQLERQVLLIVGSAGAGKTTFVDHLREVALPKDIRQQTVWIHFNMNSAPISRAEIYDWLREEIIKGCKASDKMVDYDELETIKSVNAVELNKFRKGVGRLYETDKSLYDQKLGEFLQNMLLDKHLQAQNFAQYSSESRNKLLIFVLDNCDKRLRDEQLLMFEAAQWMQKEFRGLVIMPLREETYDNHHNEAPLDTALKDLVFRIEPPLFQKILQSRVQLAMSALSKNGKKILRYELPNGMHVDYPASDLGHYLSSILRSVFEHDMHVRRLIVGLAGRNMRRAMEIFLELCTSGHISDDHILKMTQSEGKYVLPLGLVTTVLLRTNMRFYDSEKAYLKNLYASNEIDLRPNCFVRLMILRALEEVVNTAGTHRLRGFVNVSVIRKSLSKCGLGSEIFFRELELLTRGFCVTSEDFRTENLRDNDLISISPAGRVHLQLSHNIYYLAAIAEDTWFDSEANAESVAARIKDVRMHHQLRTTLLNAEATVRYLTKVRSKEVLAYDTAFSDGNYGKLTDLSKVTSSVQSFGAELVTGPWSSAYTKYIVGSKYKGAVTNHTNFGIFVELEAGIAGLVHASNLDQKKLKEGCFQIGQQLTVQVVNIDHVAKRMSLEID